MNTKINILIIIILVLVLSSCSQETTESSYETENITEDESLLYREPYDNEYIVYLSYSEDHLHHRVCTHPVKGEEIYIVCMTMDDSGDWLKYFDEIYDPIDENEVDSQ